MIKADKVYQYIPTSILDKALGNSITAIKRDDLVKYYNKKLLIHLKYQQWPEFFYIYKSAKELNHGVNMITHILAANAYVLAYSNRHKAFELLDSLGTSTAITLTKTTLELYLILKLQGIPPNTPDWSLIVNLCAIAAKNSAHIPKWEKIRQSERFAWHYDLRPWKYPAHARILSEDYRFKQRGHH